METERTISTGPVEANRPTVDVATSNAVRAFIDCLQDFHRLHAAYLYGSRARGDHRPDSDADVAIVLKGPRGDRYEAVIAMSDVAYDILLSTGIFIQPMPIWEDEFTYPETSSAPALIRTIKREGLLL